MAFEKKVSAVPNFIYSYSSPWIMITIKAWFKLQQTKWAQLGADYFGFFLRKCESLFKLTYYQVRHNATNAYTLYLLQALMHINEQLSMIINKQSNRYKVIPLEFRTYMKRPNDRCVQSFHRSGNNAIYNFLNCRFDRVKWGVSGGSEFYWI